MAIRQPNQGIDLPDISELNTLKWHSMSCNLVTPLYGGGVKSSIVDLSMPIRVSSIRGQLRFWWRLLAKHKWKLGDTKAIQNAEFSLWGGQGDDNGGRASQVFLKVSDVPKESVLKNHLKEFDELKLQYVLFPAANETDPDLKPHRLLDIKDITWTLSFAFSTKLERDEKRKQQVIETLNWWANFGGLGFRTRKGMGAVHVSACVDFPEIMNVLSKDDVALAGCFLATRTALGDTLSALRTSIDALSKFRQAPNVGRNTGQQANRPGRSRWPEPDAMRRIVGRGYDVNHQPEHPAGNIFPRALFGLPVLLHFPKEKILNATIEPAESERLASPLILRPQFVSEKNGVKQWAPAALVIPYEHIKNMQVKVNGQKFPIWQQGLGQKIKPILENGATDPLQAFLTYFAK